MIYKSLYFYDADVFISTFRAHPEMFCDNILRVYLPYKSFTDDSVKSFINQLNCEKIAIMPYINKGLARKDFSEKFGAVCRTANGFLIENVGDLQFLSDLFAANGTGGNEVAAQYNFSDKILCGDYSLNVYNAESAAFWCASGLKSVALLPEPDASEQIMLANAVCKLPENIAQGKTSMLPEIIAGGRIIVMRSEHCFITDNPKYHCGKCGKNGTAGYTLTDNAGNIFPLIGLPLDCQNLVLSAKNIEINEEYVKKHVLGDLILRYNILNDYR